MTDQQAPAAAGTPSPPTQAALAEARERYHHGRWSEGHAVLAARLADEQDEIDAARLRLAYVAGCCEEDWCRGLRDPVRKHAVLDAVEPVFDDLPVQLRADATYLRGMTLHIDFVMARGDLPREERCFTDAIGLYEEAGDPEGAAQATAMLGIFHHVDRLDRPTAQPILERAYAMAPSDRPSYARAEATRHLGQIRQELGDPRGALPLLEESLRERERLGREPALPAALHALAFAKLEADDPEGAERDLARAREVAERYDARLPLALIGKTEADLEMSRVTGPGLWRRTHP
jgi:tetratricopeptide (TPR) repeat protein